MALKGQGMAVVDEMSVQHLPHPSLSDERNDGGGGGGGPGGEPVSGRQRAEWAEFDRRWGLELKLQQETDMEFFWRTRDGQALPAAAGGAWQRGGVAVSVSVQAAGQQQGEGPEEPEQAAAGAAADGADGEKSRAVVLPGRNGWAEPEVPLGVNSSGRGGGAAGAEGGGLPPPVVAAAAERRARERRSSRLLRRTAA